MDNNSLPNGITSDNGKLRWCYAVNLWQKPILIRPLVMMMTVFLAIVVITATIAGGVTALLWALGGGLAFTVVVVGLTYLIMALIHRGQLIFLFEMDEKGVLNQQTKRQNKTARSLRAATVIAGYALGNSAMRDTGRNAVSSEFYSRFSEVKKIRAVQKHDLIRVHSPFVRNQIYASPEQYGFVWQYITSRCEGARINE